MIVVSFVQRTCARDFFSACAGFLAPCPRQVDRPAAVEPGAVPDQPGEIGAAVQHLDRRRFVRRAVAAIADPEFIDRLDRMVGQHDHHLKPLPVNDAVIERIAPDQRRAEDKAAHRQRVVRDDLLAGVDLAKLVQPRIRRLAGILHLLLLDQGGRPGEDGAATPPEANAIATLKMKPKNPPLLVSISRGLIGGGPQRPSTSWRCRADRNCQLRSAASRRFCVASLKLAPRCAIPPLPVSRCSTVMAIRTWRVKSSPPDSSPQVTPSSAPANSGTAGLLAGAPPTGRGLRIAMRRSRRPAGTTAAPAHWHGRGSTAPR